MKVLRFTAVWCEPCKMLAKNLDNVTTQVPIQVLDIDKEEDLARHFMYVQYQH